MHPFYILLRVGNILYGKFFQTKERYGRNWKMFSNKEYSNQLIYDYLTSDEPCMIARLGANELNVMVNCIGVKERKKDLFGYLKGDAKAWWWSPGLLQKFRDVAGFFPLTKTDITRFCEMMEVDIQEIDVLGSWLLEEAFFEKHLFKAKRVVLEDLEPFFAKNPWTNALIGKKVLVVHPFADTIQEQYPKRSLLFEDNLLPDFELKVIKAVQSNGGEKVQFDDWFDALQFMKDQIDKFDFDICIIGAGAYGLPLAAHVKRQGKKAIHLAGVTQLLFGIKGARWEKYIVWPYMNLFNEHWVRPGEMERPAGAELVEGACYW